MTNYWASPTKLKISAIFIFLLTNQQIGFCQKDSRDMEEFMFNSSKDFIEFEDYESAYDLLASLDSIRPNSPEYTFYIGICFYSSIDKIKSLFYFLKAKQLGYLDNTLNYYLGLSYRFNYDLDNAVYYLQNYIDRLDVTDSKYEEEKIKTENLLTQIESSRTVLDQKLSVGIQNMGEKVNSEYADYVPILLSKDSTLIFTSRRKGSTGGKLTEHGNHFEDVYLAKKNKTGEWEQPIKFPGFNGKFHDANVALNNDETELYLFKTKNNGSIYISKKGKDGKWLKPRPLKSINSKYWEGSVCLSTSEDSIFFSSDRPGGLGESDLYMAVRDSKGNWTNIKNMGETINSPFDEDSPYMYKDGKTFFFSSKGHNSIGGYDVFSTKRIDSKWGEVKNIGFPINTIDDDIYFQLNSSASFGYFSSFRHSNFKERSIGEKDLFEIVRPNSSPVYFVFKGRVYDDESKEAIPAIVTLKDKEDKTSTDQVLIVDINSGKFKYDLKFNNHYQLTIEIGDKIYFSKELFFPYQPDLFESFLDIPLKGVPSFKVKLQDLLAGIKDSTDNVVLDETINPTVVLVRNVPYNDQGIKDLLLSKKIPVSFRKRIMNQLKGTQYIDEPDEGNILNDAFSEIDSIDNLFNEKNIFQKLVSDATNTIERIDAKSFLNTSIAADTLLKQSLTDLEQRIVERLSDYLLGEDVATLKAIDELYYKDLNPKELEVVTKMVATTIKNKMEEGGNHQDKKKLYELIDHNREILISKEKMNLRSFNKEAWGVLYTIEASRFKYEEAERLVFYGKVMHRVNNQAASKVKLLLTDDRGMIYSHAITSQNGEIAFNDLLPGKRYHILVDDYSIAILGRSRYELKELSITSNDKEYLKFYKNLTPDQKRSIDRIIALDILKDEYISNPVHVWEDDAEYIKLLDEEKELVSEIVDYLSARASTDSNFFLQENFAHQYEQLNLETRERFNRYIARRISSTKTDSALYIKLSELERSYVDQLKSSRKAKRILVEDILLSKQESDFWYVLDEISTQVQGNPKAVTISGKISYLGSFCSNLQVALMDEFGQIVFSSQTDGLGSFFIPIVSPDSKFKVLINNGSNITRIRDYKLTDLKIEAGEVDFYKNLTDDEKRIIDRIIATNLSNEFYQKDSLLFKKDNEKHSLLGVEEKKFIERLLKHLYADPVSPENTYLQKRDNQHYYSSLSVQERNFINRYIVQLHADATDSAVPILLKGKDKIFYDQLTQNQKTFVRQMQIQRQLKADIFAENPELIVDKAWILMDSLMNNSNNSIKRVSITGNIIEKASQKPVYNIPVMVSDHDNNFMGMVSTDSTGHFQFSNISSVNNYYVLIESKRIFLDQSKYELVNLRLSYINNDNGQDMIVSSANNSFKYPDILTVYFDFDSYKISSAEMKKLITWIEVNKDTKVKIRLEGHADIIGPEGYNQKLSEQRAKSVKQFLIKSGVSSEKINARGFGEKKYRYKVRTMMHLDRRVEITF